MSKTIKLVLKNEIRIIPETPKSYSDLQQWCHEYFGVTNASFQYKDSEDDTVTFSTDQEYQKVLASSDFLKLFLIPSSSLIKNSDALKDSGFIFSQPEKSRIIQRNLVLTSPPPGSDDEENNPDLTIKLKPSDLLSSFFCENYPELEKEKALSCGHCMEKITGVAFVCVQCAKHVNCSECEPKMSKEHVMIRSSVSKLIPYLNKINQLASPKSPFLSVSEKFKKIETNRQNSNKRSDKLTITYNKGEKTEGVENNKKLESFSSTKKEKGYLNVPYKHAKSKSETDFDNGRSRSANTSNLYNLQTSIKLSFEDIVKQLADLGYDIKEKRVLSAIDRGENELDKILEILG